MEEEARKEEETKLRAVGAAAMAYAPGRVNEVEIRDSNRRRDRSRSRSAERRRKAALSLNNSSSMNGNSSSGISAFTTRRGDERRRDRSRERKVDDEEEIIKRRLARKLREKEESYQRLLDHWTSREKKKAYEYEKERDKERKKKEEIEAEAERLLEFFDEYDDEIEDPRYYVGTALQRRLTDRQAEKTADDRDRQKEIEQLEEARCKVIESGDPNAETIILQMEQKMQEHLRKRFNSSDNKEVRTSARILDVAREAIYQSNGSRHPPKRRDHSDDEDEGEVVEPEKDTLKIPVTQTSKANNLPANETFKREQDEEDAEEKALLEATKVKYVPKWIPSGHEDPKNLTNEEESKLIAKAASKLTEEERNALVKQIIQKIPTEKDSLFAYPIEWDFVDLEFIDNRIRPWVDKKMVSYLGEVEMTLSNFICDQLLSKNTPQKILQDISMVLDDEAEGFVVKMWRLLIYVIAAKKAGLE